MWRPYHPKLPWILWAYAAGGGYLVRCTRSGDQVLSMDWGGVQHFAADHSSGLGNLVHSLTRMFGIKRCAPCAARQAALNAYTPWRR